MGMRGYIFSVYCGKLTKPCQHSSDIAVKVSLAWPEVVFRMKAKTDALQTELPRVDRDIYPLTKCFPHLKYV